MNQDEVDLWADMMDVVDRKVIVMEGASRSIIDTEHFFGRPLLGKIVVLPRRNAEQFTHTKPWACISVSDANTPSANIQKENRIGLLKLGFNDTEYGPLPIRAEQASKIWYFIDQVWEHADIVMIHCNAGISRSPAIAKVVSEKFQPEFADYFDQLYSPNKLVCEVMKSVL